MRRTLILLCLVLAGSVPTGVSADHDRLSSQTGIPLGKIAFASARDGDFEIFVMDADGNNLVQLTHNRRDDLWPNWSPEGKYISFTRGGPRRSYVREIWTMRADGSHQKPLVGPAMISGPDWSPDGRLIAYSVSYDGASIYAVQRDGSGGRVIVSEKENSLHEDPSWSPDGSRIVFVDQRKVLVSARSRCPGDNICGEHSFGVIHPYLSNPTWSPDGQRILFGALSATDDPEDDYVDRDLHVFDENGNDVLLEAADGGDSSAGAWSPDGAQIVFYSDRGTSYDIYRIDADGTDLIQLTHRRGSDIHPDWWAPR